MIKYKTLIPAYVGVGCLTYEIITGHKIGADTQTQIGNAIVGIIGFGLSVWGVWKNHKKVGQ